MRFINKLYGKLISQRWEIGFVRNGLDGIFLDNPEYIWVKNPYKDRWFADPFVLLHEGMHTLNSYKGVTVIDVIGYNYGCFGKWLHQVVHNRKY